MCLVCLGCLSCQVSAILYDLPQPIPDDELEELFDPAFQNNRPIPNIAEIPEIEQMWGDLNQQEFFDNLPMIDFEGPVDLDREERQLQEQRHEMQRFHQLPQQQRQQIEYESHQGLGHRLQSQLIPPTVGDLVVITEGRRAGTVGIFDSITRNRAVVRDQFGNNHNIALHLIQVTDHVQLPGNNQITLKFRLDFQNPYVL